MDKEIRKAIDDEIENEKTNKTPIVVDNDNIADTSNNTDIAVVKDYKQLQNVNADSLFTKAIDKTKIDVVDEAKKNDAEFAKNFAKQIKDSATKLAEVEKEKAELEKQNVKYHEELLSTQQKLNEHTQDKNSLEHKKVCRQYHYDGVSPIMEFVGIKKPMNVVLLYFLVLILIVPFLISKLFKGTIGALIAGTEDSDRSKTAKGFIWTIIGLLIAFATAVIIYLSLGWLHII